MKIIRPIALTTVLLLNMCAYAQQTTPPTVPSPAAPPPGTVPVTSQTPVTPTQDPTLPAATAATDTDPSAQPKTRHHRRKAAKKTVRPDASSPSEVKPGDGTNPKS